MKVHRILCLLGLSATLLFSQGCAVLLIGAGAAAGAGAVAYVTGDLEVVEEVDFDTAFASSEETLREMGYSITERNRQVASTDVDGEPHDKKGTLKAEKFKTGETGALESSKERVTVKLTRRGEEQTHVSIRIGTFGNEGQSRQILEKIRKNYDNPQIARSDGT